MKPLNFSHFKNEALTFLESTFKKITASNIDVFHWPVDHLCYRTQTEAEYLFYKNELSQFSQLLIESEVNGRFISTFKLFESLKYQSRYIDLIELPAPKPGKITPTGFEHIEFVSPKSLIWIKEKYSHLNLKTAGLKKNFNQELEINLGEGSIKFHNQSLESVINLESQLLAFSALNNSMVLSNLKAYSPLVAGTFPLRLNTESSDLDILVHAKDLNKLESELKAIYKDIRIKFHKYKVEGIESLIVNFIFQKVPIEIFAQDIQSCEQRAYKHFQVEEQLLKLGGNPLRQKVMSLRQQGLKTEPAFAKALNLVGDPYIKLLDLHGLTEDKLISYL